MLCLRALSSGSVRVLALAIAVRIESFHNEKSAAGRDGLLGIQELVNSGDAPDGRGRSRG
jgi:hypothetical protein